MIKNYLRSQITGMVLEHPLPPSQLFINTVACWKKNNNGKEGVALFDGEENIYWFIRML